MDTNTLSEFQAQKESGGSSILRQQMRIKVIGVRYESPEQSVCPIMAKGSTT